jgi:hypothetical protein
MTAILQWLMTPFTTLANLPRTVAGMSLAARIAALVAVFQVVVVLLAIVVLLVGEEQQVLAAWWRPGKLAVLALLLVLTPLLVYQAARLWLERDASRFPDILAAWQGGLAELRRQGISLTEVPLFLVIGGTSDDEEQRLLAEVPGEFLVKAAPAGAAAVHLYGSFDAVFVCIGNACQLSDVVRRGGDARPAAVAAQSTTGKPPDVHGTVFLPEAAAAGAAGGEAAAPAPPAAAFDRSRTVDVGELTNRTIDIGSLNGTAGAAATASRTAAPSTVDRETAGQRLQYLCELIRRERGGLAPFNGTLAAIPWGVVQRGPTDALAVGRALGDDLAILAKGMGMRAPVTVVVLGLEREKGFCELIRRMPAAERKSRLGQRFPVGVAASYDQLGTVASRACGMVEDLVTGRILRATGVLAERDNSALVGLVSRLRGELSGRLAGILRRAFAPAEGDATAVAPLLSGCYLAACGATPEQSGFVRGVIEKAIDAQGDLEWTPRAEAEDQAAGRLATVLAIVSGLVLLGVAIALALKFGSNATPAG